MSPAWHSITPACAPGIGPHLDARRLSALLWSCIAVPQQHAEQRAVEVAIPFTSPHKSSWARLIVPKARPLQGVMQAGSGRKAGEMFQQMQRQGLTPDVVTYTAIISAYEKGGQWRLALSGYEQMRERGCRPDAIVFNAIIDALWETGVIWAQRKVRIPPVSVKLDRINKWEHCQRNTRGIRNCGLLTSTSLTQALSLFQQAVSEGHFRQQRWEGSESHKAEVNLHAMTAGVAMLSLYTWLMSLKQVPDTCCLHPLCYRSSTHTLTRLGNSFGVLVEALRLKFCMMLMNLCPHLLSAHPDF